MDFHVTVKLISFLSLRVNFTWCSNRTSRNFRKTT